MEPLVARILREYGINPETIPHGFTIRQAVQRGRDGVVIETLVMDDRGQSLLDADDVEVTYPRFYPEPSRLKWRNS